VSSTPDEKLARVCTWTKLRGCLRPSTAGRATCKLAVAGNRGSGGIVNIGPAELLLLLIVQVVFVVVSALLANRKGYSAAVWGVVAVFLGFIALIIVLLLPARTALEGGDPV
jgi:hypothetical protein